MNEDNQMSTIEESIWFGFEKNYDKMIRETLGPEFYMNENMDKPTVYEIACREMTHKFRQQQTLIASLYTAIVFLVLFVIMVLIATHQY